ncbi:MAG: hypothetical protein ACK5OX_01865 [Desertimonas sp.]
MRRGLASLLFTIAGACLALAGGGWWLQRVAFDTSTSAEIADVVVRDPGIRNQLATVISASAADQLGVSTSDLSTVVRQYIDNQDTTLNAVLRQIVTDSHARLIGERDEPVQLTGAQLVPVVRDERALALPPITLPVQPVTALNVVRITLQWFVPAAAIAGAVAMLLGFIAHPRKADAVFGVGVFLIFGAIAVVVLGWLVPVYALPEATTAEWMAVIPVVAEHYLPFVITAAVAFVVGGVGLMIASTTLGRRRHWRTPVDTSRYNEQRRWSR